MEWYMYHILVTICAKKTAKHIAKNYFANQIIFVDRVVRVGYPPKRFKPHFWFSRPDCPYTNSTDCHSDF